MNEITETSKAVQEGAKTTSKAIEATEKLGEFTAKYIAEPLEQVTGILSDKLKYMRWERQMRLLERANKFISDRGLKNNYRNVAPKMALPMIENASLEEDDFLQDIWANLLVTSIDPKEEVPRTAYIDIIKQLEPIDVKVLQFIYLQYKKAYTSRTTFEPDEYFGKNCEFLGVNYENIMKQLEIDRPAYNVSVDNLMRLRLTIPYFQAKGKGASKEFKTIYHGYLIVCITPLGISFVGACVNRN